jgi:hypothetical protein
MVTDVAKLPTRCRRNDRRPNDSKSKSEEQKAITKSKPFLTMEIVLKFDATGSTTITTEDVMWNKGRQKARLIPEIVLTPGAPNPWNALKFGLENTLMWTKNVKQSWNSVFSG